MSATATVQWHRGPTALVRVHPAGGGYGDPYDAVVLAVPDPEDPGIAVLKGFLYRADPSPWGRLLALMGLLDPTRPRLSDLRAIKEVLVAEGFAGCRWERDGGLTRPVRWRQGRRYG